MINEEEAEDPSVGEERPSSRQHDSEFETDDEVEVEAEDGSDREEGVISALTVGSAKPVKGEAFCDCYKLGREKECVCGEDDSCKNNTNSLVLIRRLCLAIT